MSRPTDPLCRGVEEALVALGEGFIAHPDNEALRAALTDGSLQERDFYGQLLRLVCRLIFQLTAEERGLLPPVGADEEIRAPHAEGNVWEATRWVLGGLASGGPTLGPSALAGLFAFGPCLALEAAKLENHALALAMSRLSWRRDSVGLARVRGRALLPEDLGAVYESLLELRPVVSVTTRSFSVAAADAAQPNARHTSGSYYTPDSLVQALVDSALEPVVQETIAANPDNPAEALLSLAIVDPACGSGNFLLAAARRLATHVARLQADGEPSQSGYRSALRRVVARCVYGVDLDPMAVELCRMALWMEALEPGSPLDTLAAHIRVGNALLGATPERMAGGIPDSAWEPLPGDDKQVAGTLKKRNNRECGDNEPRGQSLSEPSPASGEAVSGVDRRARLVADTWCAAFVWPKQPGRFAEAAPTIGVWRTLAACEPSAATAQIVEALRAEYQLFHWHLEFPQVFARGGFDVVLGNPPYLNQLEVDTAVGRGVHRLLGVMFGGIKQPYTDMATLFLVVGLALLRPGGRQALVHPLSLFAAQDAAPARRHLAERSSIASLWMTTEHIFPAAAVFVSAVCLVKAGERNVEVNRRHSNRFIAADPLHVDMDALAAEATWGELIADLLGVPQARLSGGRRIRDLAGTTADFRDQFYGLAPHIVEDGPDTPEAGHPQLIVTGLIDPAVCLWGQRGCKFAGKTWIRPRVDLASLNAAERLATWARGRLIPKIVVATQTRVIEAFADPQGVMINTVPTITVTPRRADDLWPLLAVLLSPPVSAWALGRYAGTALSIHAIKMSAAQVGLVPLPTAQLPWERAASLVEQASRASTMAVRNARLIEAAGLMCDAYEMPREPVLSWWRERLGSAALLLPEL